MRMSFALLVFFVFLLQFFVGAEDVALNFCRRQRPGASYSARFKAEYSVLCRLGGASSERNVESRRSFEFDGGLVIIECDADGAPTSLSLSPRSISGEMNGRRDFFRSGYSRFNLRWDGEKMILESDAEDFKASPQEIELLSLVFRPPSSYGKLHDLLGEKQAFAEGGEWFPQKDYIKKIFSSRGLMLDDEQITNRARFVGKSTEAVGKCAIISVSMKVAGIEGFDFEYEAEIVLPFDEKHMPVRTNSRSVEKILKKKPDKADPAFIGDDINEMLLTITYSMEVLLAIKE